MMNYPACYGVNHGRLDCNIQKGNENMSDHPEWIIKFIHKSKIHAVKIVTWEEHTEIATVPHVYTYNGEKSEGAKAAQLITTAPELLKACQMAEYVLTEGEIVTDEDRQRTILALQNALTKATE